MLAGELSKRSRKMFASCDRGVSRKRPRARAITLAVLEALESRRLLSTITFTGAGDGVSWNDTRNWSTGLLPGSSDDVQISASTTAVNFGSGSSTIHSIDIQRSLNIVGGAFTVSGASVFGSASSLSVSGGIVSLGPSATTIGAISLTGGTLIGQMTLNGSGQWNGGMLSTGTLTVVSGGTLTIGSTGILHTQTLSNFGTVNWTGGNIGLQYGATINNQAGATFNFIGDGSIYGSGNASGNCGTDTSALTVNNAGLLRKSAGTGTSIFSTLGTPAFNGVKLNNNGIVQVDTGTVKLAWGGSGTGNFTTSDSSTTIEFSGGTYTGSGSASLSGSGTCRVSGGSVSGVSVSVPNLGVSSGQIATSGTVQNLTSSGGQVTLASGAVQSLTESAGMVTLTSPVTLNQFTLTGGTLSGQVTLGNSRSGQWNGGTLSSGGLTVASGATLTIGNSGILKTQTLTNTGTINWTGGNVGLQNTATINNQSGATFNVTGDGSLYASGTTYSFYSGWVYDNSALTVNNAGLLRKSAGTGTSTLGTDTPAHNGVVLNNNGTVEVDTGTVKLAWGGSGTGGFATYASSATIQFDGRTYTGSGNPTLGGNGTYSVTSGSVSGLSISAPNLNVSNSQITFTSATLENLTTSAAQVSLTTGTIQNISASSGQISLASGTVHNLSTTGGTLTGQVTLTGSGQWNGGTLSSGTMTVASGATLTIGNSGILNAQTLTNSGTVNWTAGNIGLQNTVTINNQAGATFNITGNGSLYGSGTTPSGMGGWIYDNSALTVNNAGLLRKSAGTGTSTLGTDTPAHNGVVLNNSGAVQVDVGSLSLLGGGIQTGSFTTAGGATTQFGRGSFALNGTTLAGAGSYVTQEYTANGQLIVPTLSVTSASLGSGSTLAWNGGSFAGSGTLTVAQGANLAINLPAGTTRSMDATLVNHGSVATNSAGATIAGLTNSGTFRVNGSSVTVSSIANTGTVAVYGAGRVQLPGEGTTLKSSLVALSSGTFANQASGYGGSRATLISESIVDATTGTARTIGSASSAASSTSGVVTVIGAMDGVVHPVLVRTTGVDANGGTWFTESSPIQLPTAREQGGSWSVAGFYSASGAPITAPTTFTAPTILGIDGGISAVNGAWGTATLTPLSGASAGTQSWAAGSPAAAAYFASLSYLTDGLAPLASNGYAIYADQNGMVTGDPSAYPVGGGCCCGGSGVYHNWTAYYPQLGSGPGQGASSKDPIRYSDGAALYQTTDLQSNGVGGSFGITRDWTSSSPLRNDGSAGTNTTNADVATLVQVDQDYHGTRTIEVYYTSNEIHLFSRVGTSGTFSSQEHPLEGLTHSGSQFILTDDSGQTITFYDFASGNKSGKFISKTDAAGNSTAVTAWTSAGTIAEIQRSSSTQVLESWLYSYLSGSDPNAGRIANIQFRQSNGGGGWNLVRQVSYTYYTNADTNGNLGDLRTATVADASGTSIGTQYYRYYTFGQVNGFAGALKYVFDSASFARLQQAIPSYDAASDTAVAPYAAQYFEYDGQRRTTRHDIQSWGGTSTSGIGTFRYTYSTNPAHPTPGFNTWQYKTVEDLPDGSRNVVYLNYRGKIILFVQQPANTAGNAQWGTFYKYDNTDQVLWQAKPSAVDLPANLNTLDQYPDVLHAVNGNYYYLKDSAGEIDVTDYYTATTATATTAGGVAGYEQDTKVQHGELGTPILLSSTDYFAHSGGGVTIYPTADSVAYANEDGTGARTTRYGYTWFPSSLQAQLVSTTLPVVSAAQNGSGSANSTSVVYDARGRAIWEKDTDGFLTYTAYDNATNAPIKKIVDVNTALTGDFANLPAGWSTPAGGGLHLVTTYQVDGLGRTIKETDPAGRITYTVYKDAAHEVRIYSGWNPATGTTTGPIALSRQDRAGNYKETLTYSATPHVDANGNPDGAEAIANVQSLSRDYYNNAAQKIRTDDYFDLSGINYSTATYLGSVGVNYYTTTYAYDANGDPYRIVNATGTITERRHDGLGRVVSVWVGTSDANLVQTKAKEYDNGGVGDGNLTRVTTFGDDTTSYVSDLQYDWRDRLTASRGPDGVVTQVAYDNLNEVTGTDVYADLDHDFAEDGNELRTRSQTLYDSLGQAYRTISCAVDPTTGQVGDSLTGNFWHDARGLLIKSQDADGLFTKRQYDGAGRPVASYLSYDSAETTYAQAANVDGDTVVEQSRTWYDRSGNAIAQASYRRLENDTTTTGALTAANSYATGSVNWYDLADRLTNSANLGHESGDGTRYLFNTSGQLIDADADGIPDIAEGSPLLPNTSDDYIAAQVQYDAAGRVWRQTDNKGHVTQTEHDNVGHVTQTIANYVDGVASETETDTDQTTDYIYDGSGRLVIQRALNPQGAGNGVQNQDTRYLYGDLTYASLVTSTIYPDSSDTDASGTDQVKYTYDRLGRKLTSTDQRGVVHTYSYDSAGRLFSDAVTTLPAGVDGSVLRLEYAYDDVGRVLTQTSFDAASGGNITSQVKYTYNAWGNVIKTQQAHDGAVTDATPAVQYSYEDGAVNGQAAYVRLRSMTYPNGRVIYYNYDSTPVERLSSISDDAAGTSVLVQYTYLGASTVTQVSHPGVNGGLDLSYGSAGNYTGWDRFGQVIGQSWKRTDGTVIDGYAYTYDRNGNRTGKTNQTNSALSESYAYDGLDRLASVQQNGSADQAWNLDALGNWAGFTDQGTSQTRTADAANQTTSISGGWVTPTYDAAGNMTSGPKAGEETTRLHFTYDAWNRLIAVQADDNGQPGATLATYRYDARGYRIQKVVGADTTDFYYNDNWQVVQETKNAQVYAQYVWDVRYIDALVCRDRATNGDGVLDERLYYVQDGNFNVTALVDANGNVVERYSYDAYGKATVYDGNWNVLAGGSAYDNQVAYAGYRFDPEAGLLLSRHRYYNSSLGCWISRDPKGYVDGGNVYQMVNGKPLYLQDPTGFWSWKQTWGIAKVIGGVFETTAGVSLAIASGWTGVGAVGGGIVAIHGVDTIVSGIKQSLGSKNTDSYTSQGLQGLGMDQTTANLTDAGISVVGSLGAGVGNGLAKTASIASTEEAAGMTTGEILAGVEKGSKALPDAAFEALGGEATSALAKADMIEQGVVAGTDGLNIAKAITLAPTGLTPLGDIGAGVGGASLTGAAGLYQANAYTKQKCGK